jgi:hypothetical protein
MKNNIFDKTGYITVENAIDSDLRDFITQYALFKEMQSDIIGDGQVLEAFSQYADPVMETLLLSLVPLMEKNTGLELDPTYSYFRIYRPGNDLKIHTDRPACEISATLCFNYEYHDDNFYWPIYMESTEIKQKPGDLAIYKGCEIEHYRNLFYSQRDDVWHVQGFFHYVDKNGPNKDWKFDRREFIGSLKDPQKRYIRKIN